ncbi:MAG: hypothetical protein CFH13_00654, partial [Alphaproteobacteria bacterium MarineAlpha5_Bin3]
MKNEKDRDRKTRVMVPRGGIEPPTRGFQSSAGTTEEYWFSRKNQYRFTQLSHSGHTGGHMATIRRRNKKYQVQVRKSSHKSISKTFTDLKTAKIWANHIEDKIELGDEFVKQDNKLILRDIIQRYLNEITSQKKGKESEQRRIKRLLKEPLCDEKIHTLKTKNFVEYKNKRIKDGKRTCHYDLVLLRHMYNVAINQWNLIKIENPLINV